MSEGMALPLGSYQLSNLIKERLQFLLLSIEIDFTKAYNVVEMLHLKSHSAALDPGSDLNSQAMVQIQERSLPADYPIIVVCSDGSRSKALADFLDFKGYKNCFYLLGGFEALLAENKSSGSI